MQTLLSKYNAVLTIKTTAMQPLLSKQQRCRPYYRSNSYAALTIETIMQILLSKQRCSPYDQNSNATLSIKITTVPPLLSIKDIELFQKNG